MTSNNTLEHEQFARMARPRSRSQFGGGHNGSEARDLDVMRNASPHSLVAVLEIASVAGWRMNEVALATIGRKIAAARPNFRKHWISNLLTVVSPMAVRLSVFSSKSLFGL